MVTPLRIYKPERRICPGKTVRYQITKLDPTLWLKNSDYKSIVVDGFTINSRGDVTAILSRYEYDGEIENREHFTQTLNEKFQDEIRAQIELAHLLKVPFRIFLWSKDYPQTIDTGTKRIIVYFPKITADILDLSEAKLINLKGLEMGIQKYRGRSYKSVKSLRSANSNLECYLANHTMNPWPGDIDGILFDKSTNQVHSIIEYKTHNIDSPIEKEYIGKYGKQDWRRFEVLYNLQTKIGKAQLLKPKLFFLVWGTKGLDNHRRIKIDEINQGEVVNTLFMARPDFGSFSQELVDLLYT